MNHFEGGLVCHLVLLNKIFEDLPHILRFSARNIGRLNTADSRLRKSSVLLGNRPATMPREGETHGSYDRSRPAIEAGTRSADKGTSWNWRGARCLWPVIRK